MSLLRHNDIDRNQDETAEQLDRQRIVSRGNQVIGSALSTLKLSKISSGAINTIAGVQKTPFYVDKEQHPAIPGTVSAVIPTGRPLRVA
jgi:hypothetical protein